MGKGEDSQISYNKINSTKVDEPKFLNERLKILKAKYLINGASINQSEESDNNRKISNNFNYE